MQYKLTIHGTLPGLNEYTKSNRTNKYAAAQMKRTTQSLIGYCISQQLRNVHITQPVQIAFTWYEVNKKRDKDNVAFAKKFILDALVEHKVLQNDGWQNIDSFSDSFKIDTARPRVEVIIRETGK